ncbi:MAG: transglycosylase SLT domain-containing protein [Kiloniellales bacterium]|nr:transglycosylase SLT domain-containing protein [Kiloniellales bacterium]
MPKRDPLHLSTIKRLWGITLFFCFLSLVIGGIAPTARAAESFSQEDIDLLLMPKRAASGSGELQTRYAELLDKLQTVQMQVPLWPFYKYLEAEILLELGRNDDAEQAFGELLKFASSDPYDDTLGAVGLVSVALYRWLQIQETKTAVDVGSLKQGLGWADSLLKSRLGRSIFEPHPIYRSHPIIGSLPSFEEDIYYRLASGALHGNLRQQARENYLTYLGRLRTDDRVDEEAPLHRLVVDDGIASEDRIALFRGRRLLQLRQRKAAVSHLQEAYSSPDEQVRLEAGYWLARASRDKTRAARSEIYHEVYRYARPQLAADAMFWNALQYGREDQEFDRGLTGLIKEFPSSDRLDDALFWLARGRQIEGDLNAALAWYEELRSLDHDNDYAYDKDYIYRATFYPALGLIWRGGGDDLHAAQKLLTDYVERHDSSVNLPSIQFWLGRIAEDLGDLEGARRAFEDCVAIDAFGYYGLRARMHLSEGQTARKRLLLQDEGDKQWLRNAYNAASGSKSAPSANSYRQRILDSVGNGLFAQALAGEEELRKFDQAKRLQEFTVEELDELGLLPRLSVMIALRQDALVAADIEATATNRIAIAKLVGQGAGDWPLALVLVHPSSQRSLEARINLMNTDGYLSAAYPVVYEELVTAASAEYNVPAHIIYSVMRNESFFYPAALSSAKAFGLFQFIPSTFDDLDQQWNLLRDSGAADRRSFLRNESLSIGLAGRWFAEKLLSTFNGDPFLAVLAHHSGAGLVRKWTDVWRRQGWMGDIELMVESFRRPEFAKGENDPAGVASRKFARQLAADLAIVDALQLYR